MKWDPFSNEKPVVNVDFMFLYVDYRLCLAVFFWLRLQNKAPKVSDHWSNLDYNNWRLGLDVVIAVEPPIGTCRHRRKG